MKRALRQPDMLYAKVFLRQRLPQRGQFDGKSGVRFFFVNNDGGSNLLAGNARVQFHRAKLVGLHGHVNLGLRVVARDLRSGYAGGARGIGRGWILRGTVGGFGGRIHQRRSICSG